MYISVPVNRQIVGRSEKSEVHILITMNISFHHWPTALVGLQDTSKHNCIFIEFKHG